MHLEVKYLHKHFVPIANDKMYTITKGEFLSYTMRNFFKNDTKML